MSPQDSLAWRFHSGKLRVALVVLLVAGAAFIFGLISDDVRIELVGNVAALIVLLGLLALGYVLSCPSCGLRLVFHAMTAGAGGNWVRNLLYSDSCPRCGFRANGGEMSSNTSFERTREG
jgi:hypothetical protein